MNTLSFEVVGARVEPYAVQPTITLELGVTASEGLLVHAVALQCQIRVEPQRRRYTPDEAVHLHALAPNGEIPLLLLFSGTMFARDGTAAGVSVTPVAWHEDASFRLPTQLWRDMMDRYFPNGGWVNVSRPVLDSLARFKTRRALATWDQTLEALLKEAGEDL